MLRSLFKWISPPLLCSAADLFDLLEKEAARLTQKSTVNYCRLKAGPNWRKLFEEQLFQEAMQTCRWKAYALILADMVLVAEGLLRRTPDGAKAADRLGQWFAGHLAAQPAPAPGEDWSGALEEFQARLQAARLADPASPSEIGRHSGWRVFDLLPIHKSLRREDREVIHNQICFGMVSLHQELDRRLQAGPVAADLAREG